MYDAQVTRLLDNRIDIRFYATRSTTLLDWCELNLMS